ncbi:MAG: cation transporter [Clostridia bacterium]|nr:cation transporter [Clostridia bacterium]
MIIGFMRKRIGNLEGEMTESVRSAWGKAASVLGIGCNALLFIIKLLAGLLSGSLAITADAVNNLSDASSSVISLVGFAMAEKPADADHPYGHGRYEYLSGLMVAVLILVIGVELMKGSIEKIFSPSQVVLSMPVWLVLIASILMKTGMMFFNRRVGRCIGSKTLEATAEDSRNDVIATTAVLLSAIVSHFTGWMLDGYMGAAVAAFILVSGLKLVKETIDPMLGPAPSSELVGSIRCRLARYPGVLGMHDLMVHDYGPGRQYASVHLEMDAREDVMAAHDLIDRIERDFMTESGLHMVIHYDPVAVDDPRIAVMKTAISAIVKRIHPQMTIHDLRIVAGGTYAKLVFDCVVPYDCSISGNAIRSQICQAVAKEYPDYYCVITMEHSFIRTEQ